MGDTVWSQFLGAHEITDRDMVSYLRQGQHLCPEHTAGWKHSGPIWRARWGECRPCRPHGGWTTVLCDSSLQFYWHRQTSISTFTYNELTCICWLGRRSTNRILHMPQSHYMALVDVYGIWYVDWVVHTKYAQDGHDDLWVIIRTRTPQLGAD